MIKTKLLSISSAKLDKSQNEQFLNAVMYLEPSVNFKTICKASSPVCRQSCLVHSGMMRMQTQTAARVKRTEFYLGDKAGFMEQLASEINALIRKAERQGKQLALRLNGTSDLDFSAVYQTYKNVTFYEYTKRPDIAALSNRISNLHVTFSRTEKTKESTIKRMVEMGVNVAVVFDDKREKPREFCGIPVIDGDSHDRRFEDGKGVIVGLKLKGTNAAKEAARKGGFAV